MKFVANLLAKIITHFNSFNNKLMNLKTPIGRLRIFAILEGISYLLFAVTMPLKYVLEITEPNFYVGMTHGWLFIIYVILCIQNSFIQKWNTKTTILALVASLIPFGTFYADAKIFKPLVRSKKLTPEKAGFPK